MTGDGVEDALAKFIDLVPKATDHEEYDAENDSGEAIKVKVDASGKPAAFVFKNYRRPVPRKDIPCKSDSRNAQRRSGNIQCKS